MFRKSSYNEFTKLSYNEFIKLLYIEYTKSSNDEYQHSLFSDFTKTTTNIFFRILIATFSNAIILSQNKINNNKIIVKSTMIKTLITKIILAKIITKTHTHSTIFITIVTINLLCTCDENELFAIDNVFSSFQTSKLIFFTKIIFSITTNSHVIN